MGFEFDQKQTITICGQEYECDITNNDLMAGLMRDFPRILAIAEEIRVADAEMRSQLQVANAESYQKQYESLGVKNVELTEACRDFIHGCIGESEYEEIFANRKPNSTEHLKLCSYIFDHVMTCRNALVQEYLDLPEAGHAADNTAVKDS